MFEALLTFVSTLLLGAVMDVFRNEDSKGDEVSNDELDQIEPEADGDLMDEVAAVPPEAQAPPPDLDPVEEALVIEYDAQLGAPPQVDLLETEDGTDVMVDGVLAASLSGVSGLSLGEDIFLRPVIG